MCIYSISFYVLERSIMQSILILPTAYVHLHYALRDLGVFKCFRDCMYLTIYHSHTHWSSLDSHIDSGSLYVASHLMHQ